MNKVVTDDGISFEVSEEGMSVVMSGDDWYYSGDLYTEHTLERDIDGGKVRELCKVLGAAGLTPEAFDNTSTSHSTTKVCPTCGCTEMIAMHGTDTKLCSNGKCLIEMDWPLEKKQKKLWA